MWIRYQQCLHSIYVFSSEWNMMTKTFFCSFQIRFLCQKLITKCSSLWFGKNKNKTLKQKQLKNDNFLLNLIIDLKEYKSMNLIKHCLVLTSSYNINFNVFWFEREVYECQTFFSLETAEFVFSCFRKQTFLKNKIVQQGCEPISGKLWLKKPEMSVTKCHT